MSNRWDPCIHHRDKDACAFFSQYLGDVSRNVLLICGAGFDPRSADVARRLTAAAKTAVRGLFIREERPRPEPLLVSRADANEAILRQLIPLHRVERIPIFSQDDQAVIGGRSIVRAFLQVDLAGITDIFLDMSALSLGVSFPLAKVLFDRAKKATLFPNVHLVVTTKSSVDESIRCELIDRHHLIPGFTEDANLESLSGRTKLWLPQLSPHRGRALEIIHTALQPGETCPIVPFPARNPRTVEELVELYRVPINDPWRVDDRDFLFAAEDDPLDLYRTILRIDELRKATYAASGGSLTMLSPVGSKAMAAGALLAALERGLPVVYVETQRYSLGTGDLADPEIGLVHLWLTGDVYP